jgi:hypothetical protein
MKYNHKDKKHKITYCSKVMRDEELLGEKKSIELIRKFQQFKKHKLRELEEQEEKGLIIDDIEKELNDAVEKLEDDLMEIEMLLQDALQTAVAQFKEMINTIIADMKQQTIAYVTFVSEQSTIFGEKLTELAINEQAKFAEKIELMDNNYPEEDEEFDQMLELLGDKDLLMQWVDTSKEFFDKEIAAKEGVITKAIANEQRMTEERITQGQHKRNRGIIREIISTCQGFKNEIKADFDLIRGEEED